jgi:guanine nucleotide-binding protein subunit beta-2-like 1 protein
MSEITYIGELKGHRGGITALVCPAGDSTVKVVSASRDKTIVSWVQNDARSEENKAVAIAERRLEGHSDFVQDVALANTAEFALSASWDKALRLWNLKSGQCITKFLGHSKDVLTCAFSPDNRHIISGGRDGKLNVWNVKGENVYTLDKESHQDWVSCIRFSPATANPIFVSGGWDNVVKVWSLADFKCMHTLVGHSGYVTSVAVSPDGSLCASSSKDGTARLWDLTRGESMYVLGAAGDEPINQVAFSPSRYWLVAATDKSVRIWDLQQRVIVADLVPEIEEGKAAPKCTSVAWSADGATLYTGYTDNIIRVWAMPTVA